MRKGGVGRPAHPCGTPLTGAGAQAIGGRGTAGHALWLHAAAAALAGMGLFAAVRRRRHRSPLATPLMGAA